MTKFQIGNHYSGFILERMETIAEINSEVYLFHHELLTTPVLAIKNDDNNKTFTISFQTIPEDSTGVAHILEHSVLMGSKKYPVRDVFGEINKGGLMTFLNAMTGSDTTWYPFATRNLKEYFNIMDVYCDVTLNPLLLIDTFQQEGWHYHKEEDNQPLQFQGVVLNEMKGAYSDPIRSIFHHMYNGLMPGSTYAHESGGDPKNIPDLSYEHFVHFHKKYYHPSNAMLFFYGNAPLKDELAFIQEGYLKKYKTPKKKALINIGLEIEKPCFVEDCYGIQPGEELTGKTFHALSAIVGTTLEREQNTAFHIIANILYNSDASPLKKKILNSGLCKDFGGFFLSNSCYKTMMMTYLVGSEPQHKTAFNDLYKKALGAMVAEGLDKELILSELNKYEFSTREEMIKSQRGLDLIGKAMPALKHNGDPFEFLCMEDIFRGIRDKAMNDRYFEQLIQEYLIDNPATVLVTLKPDPEKISIDLQKEQQTLIDYENSLEKLQIQALIANTRELIGKQHKPNNQEKLKLLPHLLIEDLDPVIEFHAVTPAILCGRPFLINELPTNSIVYLDFGFDSSGLPAEYLLHLNLFATIVTEIGTSKRNYMEFARELNKFTGEFNHSFNAHNHKDSGNLQPILWFHIKALSRFIPQAMELISEVFADVSFSDKQHIQEIVQREYAWAEHSVQSEGYSIASTRVFAQLCQAGQYNEYISGATAYQALKELALNYDEQEESFLETLNQLKKQLFRRARLTVSITSDHQGLNDFNKYGDRIVESLSNDYDQLEFQQPLFKSFKSKQAFPTSSEIVYNVQGCTLFATNSLYNGHFDVLKTWLSRDYLWNTVRQIGGAYGCFIQFNQATGSFVIVSYRDPQVRKTYEAYNDIAEQINTISLSKQEIQKLIIGAYGNFDPHQSPVAAGASARNEYLSGITPEYKQKRVDEILCTDNSHLRQFAPYFQQLSSASFRATIGNSEKILKDKDLFDSVTKL